MSSIGLLAAPIAFERSRSIRQLLVDIDGAALDRLTAETEADATRFLPNRDGLRFQRVAEMRYAAQDYPLEVDVPGRWTEPATIAGVEARFRALYEDLYGRTDNDNQIEIVALRVQALLPAPSITLPAPADDGDASPKAFRQIYDASQRAYRRAPVYERRKLHLNTALVGPAVIEERESTTVIHAGDRLTVDRSGCLVIDLAASPASADASAEELAHGA
ncbi:MAG: hypothetical protein WDO24_21660 [Pseudomonadota bacterium]